MRYIQEVGSYAGFAAMVALAILAFLYFSQARDVRRLREWAGHAPERAREAQQAVDPYLPPPEEIERQERPRPTFGDKLQPRTLAIVLGVVLAIAAIAFGAVKILGSNDQPKAGSQAAQQADRNRTGGDVAPGDVTVAVLNGTSVPGLGAKVATDLKKAGFKIGTTTNATQQDIANTTVAYTKGEKLAGRKVAKQLGTDPPSPLSAQDASIAGNADVVVTVGSDRI